MDPRCVYCKILPGWHTSIDEAEELPLELSKKKHNSWCQSKHAMLQWITKAWSNYR